MEPCIQGYTASILKVIATILLKAKTISCFWVLLLSRAQACFWGVGTFRPLWHAWIKHLCIELLHTSLHTNDNTKDPYIQTYGNQTTVSNSKSNSHELEHEEISQISQNDWHGWVVGLFHNFIWSSEDKSFEPSALVPECQSLMYDTYIACLLNFTKHACSLSIIFLANNSTKIT